MTVRRDAQGNIHVVALSGGHDSTALALELRERNPDVPYNFVCTPTGDELPEMFAHWRDLGERLGSRLIPIMNGTLKSVIAKEKTLPNFRMRFCTRILKIEPYREWLAEHSFYGRTISYVGLRADEPGRAGGAYDDIPGVEMYFPLREWGWGEDEVQACLRKHGVKCPDRTDCARCYHQRIGEWYELWRDYPDIFADAIQDEADTGNTYRTPGRDTWPTALIDMHDVFSSGKIPTSSLKRMERERMASGSCRVCSL